MASKTLWYLKIKHFCYNYNIMFRICKKGNKTSTELTEANSP